jgi:arylsulfatase A-like enzyme
MKLVQNIDLFPTVTELLGVEASELQPCTLGKSVLKHEGHAFVISEYLTPVFKRFEFAHRDFDTSEYDRQLRTLRDENYKLIFSSDGAHELYHIFTDPHEQVNLIASRPQVANEMMARLQQWERTLLLPQWEGVTASIDGEVEQRLRDLGYL